MRKRDTSTGIGLTGRLAWVYQRDSKFPPSSSTLSCQSSARMRNVSKFTETNPLQIVPCPENGLSFFFSPDSHIEENEVHQFETNTEKLLKFALSQPPFECKDNCKAPSGTYQGSPWIQTGTIKARKGELVRLHCQIWTKFNNAAAKGQLIL